MASEEGVQLRDPAAAVPQPERSTSPPVVHAPAGSRSLLLQRSQSPGKLRVAFIHLDTGIGGAERWMVDSAVGLQSRGHDVSVFTSFHDPDRCFEETRDGTLRVTVYGSWLPRSIGRKFHLLMSFLRMLWVSIHVLLNACLRPATHKHDVYVVDQVSAVVPLFRLCGKTVVFYCHYPDLLLADHSTFLKRSYRFFLDWFEEWSTGCSTAVLVNSKYTFGIFRSTFKSLRGLNVQVLYPCIACVASSPSSSCSSSRVSSADHSRRSSAEVSSSAAGAAHRRGVSSASSSADDDDDSDSGSGDAAARNLPADIHLQSPVSHLSLDGKIVFVSLNRFERKKNIALAVSAFAELATMIGNRSDFKRSFRLVLAGGYDPRVDENREVVAEVKDLVTNHDLNQQTHFVLSCTDSDRRFLFRKARALLYTPENEHFGITPLEAMYEGLPVIACNSGGPLETIIHKETGFLVEPTREGFATAMFNLSRPDEDPSTGLRGDQLALKMSSAARLRVEENFLLPQYSLKLERILLEAASAHL